MPFAQQAEEAEAGKGADKKQTVATSTGAAVGLDSVPGTAGAAGPGLLPDTPGTAGAANQPLPAATAAIGAAAVDAALKVTAPAANAALGSTPAPVQKFKIYNEQWLEQAEGIAEDFVATPAMERLKSGQFGEGCGWTSNMSVL